MKLPVGTLTPRPNELIEGMMREYENEEGFVVQIYKDGQWQDLIRMPPLTAEQRNELSARFNEEP